MEEKREVLIGEIVSEVMSQAGALDVSCGCGCGPEPEPPIPPIGR